MFSVNIDKLVEMTPTEKESYAEVVNSIVEQSDKIKTLAIVNGGVNTFKIAYEFVRRGLKVLFIDGNIKSDTFLGKYRLGKDMDGVADYLRNPDGDYRLICQTNQPDLNIVFTGNIGSQPLTEQERYVTKSLIREYRDVYDYIIMDADDDGSLAKYCVRTAIMVNEDEYSENYVNSLADHLEKNGCKILGVITAER